MTRLVVNVLVDEVWRNWGRVDALTFSTFEQGEELARGTVRMDRGTAVNELAQGVRRLRIGGGGLTVWEGRVEDVALVTGGIDFVAFGLWRAVDDLLYTAFWRDVGTALWYEPFNGVTNLVDLYRKTTDDNSLYISPDPDGSFIFNNTAYGRLAWALPDRSLTKIQQIAFEYNVTATTDWEARVVSYSGARRDGTNWTGRSVLWSLRGNGGSQTGSQTLAVSDAEGLVLEMSTYTGITTGGTAVDVDFVQLRQIDIRHESAQTDEVAAHVLAYVAAQGWIRDSVFIPNSGITLGATIYEDARPSEVLTRLAEIGDGTERWRVGVDGQNFQFAPATGRVWQVSLADLAVQNSTNGLANAVYATYDYDGVTLRTTTATDAASVTRWGMTKTAVVDAGGDGDILAGQVRDLALADGANPAKRVRLGVRRVQRWGGGTAEVWEMRAGDEVVLVDLPVVTAQVAGIRFRLARVEVDVVNKSVSVETDNPTPNLENFLLRREA
jgi:hypothetical protein